MTSSKPKLWLRLVLPLVLVIAWIGFTGVGGSYFEKISDVSSNDLTTFLPESAEATKVNKEQEKFRGTNSLPAIIVFKDGDKLAASTNQLTAVKDRLQKVDGVNGAISPAIISDDKHAAILVIPLDRNGDLQTIIPDLRSTIDKSNLEISYYMGGPAAFSQDLQKAFGGIDGTLLAVALAAVFIILLIVYRSPFLPLLVLLSAIAALSVAILVVWWLAKEGVVELNGQVQGILFILVIGATTDYALLYLSRLREELFNHKHIFDATKAALKGSFESILGAGGTVIVGLMCLLISDLGSNKALGPVGGIGIIFAVLSALTFLPAMLLLFGRAVFWPRRPIYDPKHMASYNQRHKLWSWIGRLVQHHPRRLWIGISTLLLIACLGVFQLKADGVSQNDLVLGYSEARQAQQIISEHFPDGSGSPAYILINPAHQGAITTRLDADKGISSLAVTANHSSSKSMPIGESRAAIEKEILQKVTADRNVKLAELRAGIEQKMVGMPPTVINQAFQAASANIPSAESIAAQAYPFKNATPKVINDTMVIEATLADAADSQAARTTIQRLRTDLKTIDSSALVGGLTAIQHDTNQAGIHDRTVIIPAVLAAITIILSVLLRSVIAPILLLLTTVISFVATLGISALLFNHILGFPGTDPSVILYGFVFLVALGIDYNIFLMTRVREETSKSDVTRGTIKALVVTGGVITSAGIVLAATFAALNVLPILFLAQIAFIVAFGVLLDTIIVRSLLVPALTLETGKLMWWPSRLGKKQKR